MLMVSSRIIRVTVPVSCHEQAIALNSSIFLLTPDQSPESSGGGQSYWAVVPRQQKLQFLFNDFILFNMNPRWLGGGHVSTQRYSSTRERRRIIKLL